MPTVFVESDDNGRIKLENEPELVGEGVEEFARVAHTADGVADVLGQPAGFNEGWVGHG